MLQSFHLAPPSRLNRLHDTRLEPTHGPRDGLPVEGLPLSRLVGSRTSNQSCRHLPYLLCRLAKLSRAERPEGSLLAFAQDDVAHAQSLSNLLPAGLRFLPPPLPARLS